MRITRIYQASPLAIHQEITLDKIASNHLANVLRLSIGAAIIVFNGEGGEYQGEIVAFEKKLLRIRIDDYLARHSESPCQIHLGQVLARGERMDWVMQKASELGVHAITPLISKNCQVKLPKERMSKRMRHWQSIIISACEQCGRTHLPTLHPLAAINDWIAWPCTGTSLILDPESDMHLSQIKSTDQNFRLLIGPEGGFTTTEVEQAQSAGFSAVSLGPRILRTETAAITGVSLLQFLWGDM